jgi:uncharacterized membrane protein YraQ (UPF0718 family)
MLNNTIIFGIFTVAVLIASLVLDKNKTVLGLKRGGRMFFNILHPFLNILILISVALFFIPSALIAEYLGANSGWPGFIIAAIIGSITLIPGFVSYPLAATLLKQGASYGVVAVFITTLMMVGVVTLPLEIKYFGRKTAVLRNAFNFVAALIIGIIMGWLM